MSGAEKLKEQQKKLLALKVRIANLSQKHGLLTAGYAFEITKAEQEKLDQISRAISDLKSRERKLTRAIAATEGKAGSLGVDYDSYEYESYFGGKVADRFRDCTTAVLSARISLNAPLQTGGLTALSFLDVASLFPATAAYAGTANTIIKLLTDSLKSISVDPKQTFDQIGVKVTDGFSSCRDQMVSSSSPERTEIYQKFVEGFVNSSKGRQVERGDYLKAIDDYATGLIDPKLAARSFLMKCTEYLQNPFYEWGLSSSTGEVILKFDLKGAKFEFESGYIDDAPPQLVEALRSNFGASTPCVELPLSMKIFLVVPTRRTPITVVYARKSKTPGDEKLETTSVIGDRWARQGFNEILEAFETQKPYARIKISQIKGD